MKALSFTLRDLEGRECAVSWNGGPLDYRGLRGRFSEQSCVELLHRIKHCTGKRMAIFYGNCQTSFLMSWLADNREFSHAYFLLQLPTVCEYDTENAAILDEAFWGSCDLLVSQRVHRDNHFAPLAATQRFPAMMPESAKVIWIPNVYFEGYWPTYARNARDIEVPRPFGYGLFPFACKGLDAYLGGRERVAVREYAAYIEGQSFLGRQMIEASAERSLRELERREWPCDIHMLDFVADNYRKRQLFWSPNHPFPSVLMALAQRILAFMGISDRSFLHTDALMGLKLDGQDIPVYPVVQQALGLREAVREYWANKFLWDYRTSSYVDFWVEQAKWCWKDRLVTQ